MGWRLPKDHNKHVHAIVCNYAPKGNLIGEQMYSYQTVKSNEVPPVVVEKRETSGRAIEETSGTKGEYFRNSTKNAAGVHFRSSTRNTTEVHSMNSTTNATDVRFRNSTNVSERYLIGGN
uniref:Venom allergen 3 n=1 Tax=Lygus hesperus TaxID=30085 RepID=A0A0A9ZHV7_LYGHE